MAVLKLNPQTSFEEQLIVDPRLEETIGEYLDLGEHHRNWLKAKAVIKEAIKSRPEGRHRCGSYVLEVKDREGGGISIPDWTAKVFSVKGP